MRPWALRVTWLLLWLAIAACGGRADSSERPLLDNYIPLFSLTQPLSVSGLGGITSDSVRFQLPSSAGQGVDGWYILELTLRVDLDPMAGLDARNYVSVDTNGRTAAQIKFERDVVAGQSAVRWSTTELFTGSSRGIAFGTSLTISYSNYLQVEGVRPGENVLTLKLEQPQGIVVRSVTLETGSNVSKGRLGPPRLTIDVNSYPRRVKVGRVFTVRYRVTDEGYPAKDVGVTATTSGMGLLAAGPASHFYGWLSGEDQGKMTFVAIAAGKHVLNMQARGATGGVAQKRVEIDVH